MNKIDIGTQRFGVVFSLGEKGHGGAHHEYSVKGHDGTQWASVSFQNGPIKESGVNGCHHEDLLVIVMHRLQSFQKGKYACPENAMALECIGEAMQHLNDRTADRQRRAVEGISAV